MFRKSPYLDALPVISVDLSRISAYHLREAHAEGQYCTAEVAIALLDLPTILKAARALGDHFSLFRTRYLAGKRDMAASQHKWQKAFKIIRSLGIKGDRYEPTRPGSTAASKLPLLAHQ